MQNRRLYSEYFAPYYDEISKRFFDYDKKVASFMNLLKKDDRIFEIGIGTGLFAVHLHNEGFLIEGIDKSRDMIKLLKKNFPDLPAGFGDIKRYNFFRNYDVILMHSSVFLFTNINGTVVFESYLTSEGDMIGVLDKLYDSLNIGGRLIMNIQKNPKKIYLNKNLFYGLISKYYFAKKRVVKEHFLIKSGDVIMKNRVKKYTCFYNHFVDLINRSKFKDSSVIKNDEWVILQK